jgi:hypothetical protein
MGFEGEFGSQGSKEQAKKGDRQLCLRSRVLGWGRILLGTQLPAPPFRFFFALEDAEKRILGVVVPDKG